MSEKTRNVNNINLKEQFYKMYVNNATSEQLQYIDMLLDQGKYQQVDAIFEEYAQSIIDNKEINNSGSSNPHPV